MLKKVFGGRDREIIKVDLHSHLLPNVDDGVRNLEESVKILEFLESLGYEKVIITPHIYPGVFPNTEQELIRQFEVFKNQLNLSIRVQLAAEYYSDESLLEKLKKGVDLLTFGDNHVLIETSFFTRSILLEEVIFQLKANDYKPILAHPERYFFAHEEPDFYERIKQKGVLFQLNAGSVVGGYGKEVKKVAEHLIRKQMIDLIGSDIHRFDQARSLKNALNSRQVKKIDFNNILNNQL